MRRWLARVRMARAFARWLAAFMESTIDDILRGLVTGIDRLWYG